MLHIQVILFGDNFPCLLFNIISDLKLEILKTENKNKVVLTN